MMATARPLFPRLRFRPLHETVTAAPGVPAMAPRGPVVAGVGRLLKSNDKIRKTSMSTAEELDRYTTGRGGLFGTLMDWESGQCARMDVFPRFRTADGLQPAGEYVTQLWSLVFSGPAHTTSKTQIETAVRLLRTWGRCAVLWRDTTSGLRVQIAPIDGYLTAKKVKGVEGWALGQGGDWLPNRSVTEMWIPDPANPDIPWSPYFRLVGQGGETAPLAMLYNSMRCLSREMTRFLSGADALWFEGDPADLMVRQPDGSTTYTPMANAITGMLEVMRDARNDVEEETIASSAIIPIVSPSAPTPISLTAGTEWQATAKRYEVALGVVASATPYPNVFITEGASTGVWRADVLQLQHIRENVFYPIMDQVVALLTGAVLHPLLNARKIENVESYEIGYDRSGVEGRTLTPEQAASAWGNAIISRLTYARALGITEDDLLALPAGVNEMELWEVMTSRGRTTAAQFDYAAKTNTAPPEFAPAVAAATPVATPVGPVLLKDKWWEA
jgi:hypothetical protein